MLVSYKPNVMAASGWVLSLVILEMLHCCMRMVYRCKVGHIMHLQRLFQGLICTGSFLLHGCDCMLACQSA